MNLRDLIIDLTPLKVIGDDTIEIHAVEFDSRAVGSGAVFVAVRGEASDGHLYIYKAIENGATAVVCQQLPDEINASVTYVLTDDSHSALGRMASTFYGNPSSKLKLVGITGTNGKTTTATLLYDIFKKAGYKVGLISTVVYYIDDLEVSSTHTTPDAVRLNRMMAEMVECGCQYCFMEVSSHSLVQRRIEGLTFAGAAFTNITLDHLDYHKTFAEYIKAKKTLFDSLDSGAFAITNKDDKNGMVMLQNCSALKLTYSLRSLTDYKCKIIEEHFDGMLLQINSSELWVRFIGGFNAYNLTLVFGVASQLGIAKDELLQIMSTLNSVRGRFENVTAENGVIGIVDYAHTPDALENVINTINNLRDAQQKLYVVVGCGGDRDRSKRPIMASIAVKNSDMAILTSDNPRSEDPQAILDEMKTGVTPNSDYITICDRREAIRTAVKLAKPHDIVLIAGKGHETYQEIKGVRNHFDDLEEFFCAGKAAK